MKNALAAIIVLSFFGFAFHLSAQSRGAQRTQVAAPSTHADLHSALVDLDRISEATQNDIANMHVEKWKSGWKTGFLKDGSHTGQAQQSAGSLQRNLANAMPGLIRDAETSRGSISATFKLYDDVSLVCEALDSLINASEVAGHKGDSAPLVDDYSALTRIRRSISTYIQQASANGDPRGRMPFASAAAPSYHPAAPRSPSSTSTIVTNSQGVKKIVVDDTIPEKKSAQAAPATKKKSAPTLSNIE